MNDLITNCKDCQEQLADLLLDPASASSAAQVHLSACTACREELASLRATFSALDAWTAPEPSAYFDTRLYARLREAQAAPAEGFFERMRSFLLFSTGRQFRPAVAGVLALVLVVSGGTIGLHQYHGNQTAQASATINDLKVLDNNFQAMQQMDQLLDDNSDDDPPTT